MPRLRAERWTSIFAISPRCGWFGGTASSTCTVPTSSDPANAPRIRRRPRSTSSAHSSNAARASSCENGSR